MDANSGFEARKLASLRLGERVAIFCLLAVLVPSNVPAWDSKAHSAILDGALTAVSARDRLAERLGQETWRMRYYAQMADWWDCFVSASDDWTIRSEGYEPRVFTQFYGNDYLIFPGWPGSYYNPGDGPNYVNSAVLRFHHSSFLRALQALRTESPANAARWIGNLVHEVQDGSAPPHVWRIPGDPNMKVRPNAILLNRLESWVDAARIDLTGYKPQLLGQTDEGAAKGLLDRAAGLIEFTRDRTPRMMRLSDANDRPKVEVINLEIVTETARVLADAIHTLIALASQAPDGRGAALVVDVSAPAVVGMDVLPAKLVLLGTAYSTLSELLTKDSKTYRGSFSLRNIPPGEYRGVVERVGARPFPVGRLQLRAGQTVRLTWQLQSSDPPGNLIRNPDFQTSWVTKDAPDHWVLGGLWRIWRERENWVSDNTPVYAGRRYRAGYERKTQGVTVQLEWMEEHWKPLDAPAVILPATSDSPAGIELVVPPKAIYARCIVEGSNHPADSVRLVFLTQLQQQPTEN